MKLSSLLIGSENPKILSDFYSEVLKTKPSFSQDNYVGIDTKGTYIVFGPHDKVHGRNPSPERIIIFFESNDVNADFERVKLIDGVTVIQKPYSPGGDDKMLMATLADPDGNYFQIASPMPEN